MEQPLPRLAIENCNVIEEDTALLQHAVKELVRFGRTVDVSPEDMISLLESGVSVPDLLAFLTLKASVDT